MQIVKEEDELNKAFGSGPAKLVLPKPADTEEGPKMTKIMIFGNANQCEIAQRMIEEAIDNKVRSSSVHGISCHQEPCSVYPNHNLFER